MKLFELIEGATLHLKAGHKRIPAAEVSTLLQASEALQRVDQEIADYKSEVAKECDQLKEESKKEGFEEGQKEWANQLAYFKSEIERIEKEVNKTLAPLALTAVKKIVGKEIEVRPEVILDIVKTALKPVSQHKKITIYVNKEDLERVEEKRQEIKEVFEHLETLSIKQRDDVQQGGCIIETEAGIINAQLESQLKALESAFTTFFKQQQQAPQKPPVQKEKKSEEES
jgi:type III secretion protein L